jgi:hypothetical protein
MLIKPSLADVIRYGVSFSSNAGLVANTPQMVFAAGSNLNGAIIWRASTSAHNGTTSHYPALLAKATAPTSVVDGDVVEAANNYGSAGGGYANGFTLRNPVFVPAGLGLYFINMATEGSAHRSCLYSLL